MNIVLLDADVIIDLHKFDIWEQILKKNNVCISSVVLRQEVYFYEDENGNKHSIDLGKDIGFKFKEISVAASNLKEFLEQFDPILQQELHTGELEALKILDNNKTMLFCTFDKAAIRAIAILGKRDQGISFEKLLKSSGITKKLKQRHTDKYFKKCLDEGSLIRIQGDIFQKKRK